MNHIRNQLSFDLWYVFLGTFCICVAEAGRIADNEDPAFSVFSIMFEVVSDYGNVGLSLVYPTNLATLSGEFTVFSKLIICAMMIRGRHRGLPYALDRAVTLAGEHLVDVAWDVVCIESMVVVGVARDEVAGLVAAKVETTVVV